MDRSERIGLSVATAGHVLLIALLALGLGQRSVTLPPPPRTIDVSLADDVALESMSTTPPAPAQRAEAPELGPAAPETAPTPAPAPPEPAPAPRVEAPAPAPPPPKPIERPAPKPTPAKPVVERPKPKPAPEKPAPAKPQPAKPVPAKSQAKPAAPAKPAKSEAKPAASASAKPGPAKPAGAARLGADFLTGLDDGAPARSAKPAASSAPMGPAAARALNAEINRQIKPYWRPPSGADADQLVTLLSVHLDRSGAVVGDVEVVGQQGITASNRAQAALHAERAIQAVRRASPFQNLPAEYYAQWNWLKPLRFDARLAQ